MALEDPRAPGARPRPQRPCRGPRPTQLHCGADRGTGTLFGREFGRTGTLFGRTGCMMQIEELVARSSCFDLTSEAFSASQGVRWPRWGLQTTNSRGASLGNQIGGNFYGRGASDGGEFPRLVHRGERHRHWQVA